jgi:isopentenyl-diphosphate delta-isomerase
MSGETENRKLEHIKICLEEEVESSYTGLEDVMLVHNALPDLNFEDLDTEIKFMGKKLSAPFLIASMTGGHRDAIEINRNLAQAVEETGIGMGVGSQRAAIEDERLIESFTVVRDYAPNSFIYANIGMPQVLEHGLDYVEKAVEMIDADAIAIHLNFLQEAIQPEGEVNALGSLETLKEVSREVKVPVIMKETGAGISKEVALKLKEAEVKAVDIGGKGGTSWSGVETYRTSDEVLKEVGLDFWDWGIPTAFCITDVYKVMPVIATGGLRNGIDLAKSLSLGAIAGSAALPLLYPATVSAEEVKKSIRYFLKGFKVAMFLTGCRKVENLRNISIFVHGNLRKWLEYRGVDIVEFSQRR